MRILTPEQMKEIERIAIDEFGIPSLLLMENAATGVFTEITQSIKKGKALIYVGPGNNGGDGLAVGRKLAIAGFQVKAVLLCGEEKLSEDGKLNLHLYKLAGGKFGDIGESADFIIDAIFGIGLNKQVTGKFLEATEAINRSGVSVFSIDVPSGLCALTGNVLGAAVQATKTITFSGCKTGLLLEDGMDYAGEVVVAELGIPETEDIKKHFTIKHSHGEMPVRRHNSYKGKYGKVLCIAGSNEMRGAASLVAMGAFDTGAGLVSVATTEKVWQTVSTLVPRATGVILEENEFGGISASSIDKLMEAVNSADAVVAGPGMLNNEDTRKIIKALLAADKPLVLDADGLNVIVLSDLRPGVVITPHQMEMSRLIGISVEKIKENAMLTAKDLADSTECVVLLKGCGTVIAGKNLTININGSPKMAVGGSGDLLAGRIGALVGQGFDLETAASTGAFLNGIALKINF